MSEEYRVTPDSLIKDELDGKANAIARYDEMLWKIRTGYSVFLYGAIGIIAALAEKKIITLNLRATLAIGVVIFGFSAFAILLDYSFMIAKLRVVDYRDRLIALAYERTKTPKLDTKKEEELLECLKNSGERRDDIDWSQRSGRWVPPLFYGGTFVACVAAAWILHS